MYLHLLLGQHGLFLWIFQIAKGAKASATTLAVTATLFFSINIVNFCDQLRQILPFKQQSKESFTAIKIFYCHKA